MKKFLFALLVIASFASCQDETEMDNNTIEATIEGRWVLRGFEETIRYEFTGDKRYTIYGTDGTFPTLEEFLAENPNIPSHDWYYEGETVVVDLHFGNFSRMVPQFKCGNHVIGWTQEDGSEGGTYYREQHDITECE